MNVLICEDHTVVREGLRSLLETAGDIEVVGEAENGHRALRERQAEVLQLRGGIPHG